jgi:hypothetical protein
MAEGAAPHQQELASCWSSSTRPGAGRPYFAAHTTADGTKCGSSGKVIGRTPLIERMANFGSRCYSSAKRPGKCAAPHLRGQPALI